MNRKFALLAAAALALPLALAGTAASAATPPPPDVRAEGLMTPLKLALDLDGSIYVTENFAGKLDKIARDGTLTTLYTSVTPGGEVGGVSAFHGIVYFTETVIDEAVGPVESYLKKIDRKGNVTQLADIRAFENATNPDGNVQYGFSDLDATCIPQIPPYLSSGPGIKDSHPYATLGTPFGTVVADAGANALFSVDTRGSIRTLAVFPPQPYVVTEAALPLGIPECALGHTYNFEAVPTDVELGPDGWLYVSLLPGGPEDPSLGARASVVKVNPLSGKVVTVASGLLAATDLAVSPKGDIYVAQLFGPSIVVVKKGTSQAVPFRDVAAAAVEWAPRGIYATLNAFPPGPTGQVVKLPF